jgi:hypothetical protein
MNSIGNLVYVSPRLAIDMVHSAPRPLELRKKGQKNMCLINPYKWAPHTDLSLTNRPHIPFSPILSALSSLRQHLKKKNNSHPMDSPLVLFTDDSQKGQSWNYLIASRNFKLDTKSRTLS